MHYDISNKKRKGKNNMKCTSSSKIKRNGIPCYRSEKYSLVLLIKIRKMSHNKDTQIEMTSVNAGKVTPEPVKKSEPTVN